MSQAVAPSRGRLAVHPLRGPAFWATGGVCNTGFVIGDSGVTVIDAQKTLEDAREMQAGIAQITDKPITAMVLTHADPDHVGGLPAFDDVTTIVAQENTSSIFRASIADSAHGGPIYGPMYEALADHFPTQTVAASRELTLNGTPMVLLHVAAAHTPADMIVYLPALRLVYAGDVLVNTTKFPVIHAGGTSLGWMAFMRAMLALDADLFVPGHGAIETRESLEQRLREAEQRRDAVKGMADAGEGLDAVLDALPEPRLDPRFPTYTQTVYAEVTMGYPTAQAPWAMLTHV